MVKASLPGLPILTITTVPQQLPITAAGVTVMNTGSQEVTLSTDENVTDANSFPLAINGAIPLNSGPVYASVSTGQGKVVILNAQYNITNPLVAVTQPVSYPLLTAQTITLQVNGATLTAVAPASILRLRAGLKLETSGGTAGSIQIIAKNLTEDVVWVNDWYIAVDNEQFIDIPISLNEGDDLQLTFSANATLGSLSVNVIGLTGSNGNTVVPGISPQSTYSIGGFLLATKAVNNTTGQILPAPLSSLTYRLHKFSVSGNALTEVIGVTSGFVYTATATTDNLDGQIVSEALEVTSAGNVVGNLSYDQIAEPVIL